jgi:hypothetical protein
MLSNPIPQRAAPQAVRNPPRSFHPNGSNLNRWAH